MKFKAFIAHPPPVACTDFYAQMSYSKIRDLGLYIPDKGPDHHASLHELNP